MPQEIKTRHHQLPVWHLQQRRAWPRASASSSIPPVTLHPASASGRGVSQVRHVKTLMECEVPLHGRRSALTSDASCLSSAVAICNRSSQGPDRAPDVSTGAKPYWDRVEPNPRFKLAEAVIGRRIPGQGSLPSLVTDPPEFCGPARRWRIWPKPCWKTKPGRLSQPQKFRLPFPSCPGGRLVLSNRGSHEKQR